MQNKMKEKDLLTILGYATLILGLISQRYEFAMTALFLYSMGVGFFGRSCWIRFVKPSETKKERK